MSQSVVLGEIDVPSGVLVVLDPGLGRFWRHDGDPRSPTGGDTEQVDLAITGPDAVAAGRSYDRQFDPRYLFDIPRDRAEGVCRHFAAFAAEHGLTARADRLADRVPHTERARSAIEIGAGAGVVRYNGLYAVAVDGLPADRALPVVATPMPDGEFAGRWRSIDVVVDPTTTPTSTVPTSTVPTSSKTLQGVMVDYGQLLCSDLDALGEFRMWESLDGLGDFLFWGADAAEVAGRVGAPRVSDSEFGWKDLPIAELDAPASRTQQLVDVQRARVAVDFRPHDNLERLNAQIRASDTGSGVLSLAGARACGFDNRWGDGIFTAVVERGPSGELVRVRLDVGNEGSQRRLRRARLSSCGAVVSGRIWDDGEPPRFIERMAPVRPDDSGWCLTSGTESQDFLDDPANSRLIRLSHVIERFPALGTVIDAPVGSLFHLDGEAYIPD